MKLFDCLNGCNNDKYYNFYNMVKLPVLRVERP